MNGHQNQRAHQESICGEDEALEGQDGESQENEGQDADLASILDEAFVAGYALHSGWFAARSRLVREQAVRFGAAHPDLPGIVRFVSEQGEQEGLYASIFMRRDRLWHTYDLASRTWSKKLSLTADHDALVAAALKAHASAPDNVKTRHAAIKAALLPILAQALNDDPADYHRALTVAANSQVDAKSEGAAAAASLHALHANHPIPSSPAIVADGKEKLKRRDDFWPNGQLVLNDQLDGLSGDLSKSLSAQIAAGATPAQMADTSQNTLEIGAGAAFYMDQHIQAALIVAMIAYYATKHLDKLWFITMGDGRTCFICLDIEAENPYTIDSIQMPPVHGGCRCIVSPSE
jgi:hypothetical protein